MTQKIILESTLHKIHITRFFFFFYITLWCLGDTFILETQQSTMSHRKYPLQHSQRKPNLWVRSAQIHIVSYSKTNGRLTQKGIRHIPQCSSPSIRGMAAEGEVSSLNFHIALCCDVCSLWPPSWNWRWATVMKVQKFSDIFITYVSNEMTRTQKLLCQSSCCQNIIKNSSRWVTLLHLKTYFFTYKHGYCFSLSRSSCNKYTTYSS